MPPVTGEVPVKIGRLIFTGTPEAEPSFPTALNSPYSVSAWSTIDTGDSVCEPTPL